MHNTSRRFVTLTVALLALTGGLALLNHHAAAKPPGGGGGGTPAPVEYELVTIGTFGSSSAWVNGMNDHGDVVGAYDTGDWQSAFVWFNDGGSGVPYDVNDLLAAPQDWFVYDVTGINNVGQICGTAVRLSDSATVAVRIEPAGFDGSYTSVTTGATVTVVNAGLSYGVSINDSGDVVGWDDSTPANLSFLYTDEDGLTVDLGDSNAPLYVVKCISNRLDPDDPGSAYIAGLHSGLNGKAVCYTPGVGNIYLGALKSGGISLVANFNGVNDAGQCTGSAPLSSGTWHAWRYTDGVGMKDLGPSKSIGSGGSAINNAGDVIGGVGGDKPYPFLYLDTHGMLDVRKLSADIPDTATGINLRDINNGRDIAADIGGVAVFLRASVPQP